MRRLAAVAVLVAAVTGCSGHVADSTHVGRTIPVDTGLDRRYDNCTYKAFVERVSPRPCWRLLGVAS